MKTHGTLIKWNDQKGYGFVALPQNAGEVFVHISAFPRDGVRPTVGETISFEVITAPDGRKRAENVMRPKRNVAHRIPCRARGQSKGRTYSRHGSIAAAFGVAALIGALSVAFNRNTSPNPPPIRQSLSAPSETIRQEPTPAQFKCDGRTRCGQMTSCAEATFFLRNCPNIEMDGDHDGIPCEDQFCH